VKLVEQINSGEEYELIVVKREEKEKGAQPIRLRA
jgi:hypothetical protein